ncbi:MAG: branched-chain amino acid ABC transporter permease [Anaerolineae bacterium]|uniref:branched-chain amino acid ABC transporter permease n=1 Tax=Promineifilum sp. TaxID=2664178 RepID=UPI001D9EBDF9|nr:branched-chain amino acid ABC transporter permease [Anaerolineales bacterium]MCB8934015.1 branched-chain amino acid ABC transporter permease [Promineifilum sp.]MCO5179414.1 branched-chain amino acid ABC transporter permease [Promineifilum sp.]MCW5845870.1 branched-chain amino acid ABC transporter permease [Anaerolineae bacterium]
MTALRPAGDFDRTYEQDMSVIRRPWQWVALAVVLLLALTAPRWGSAYLVSTANHIFYTIIAVQGLNVLVGYTGQISLGQAAFMLVGGYTSALVTTHLGLPFPLAVLVAGLSTGLVGLLFGLPSLRVKGFYLAMATLAAQFIIPWVSRHLYPDLLGGTSGRITAPVPVIFGISFGEVNNYFYLSLITLILTTILMLNISRSRLGRAFVSLRDNDLAAELLGVNLFGYKLRAFFIASFLAGVAGALKAHSQRGVGTEFGYGLEESIIMLGMLVIGGLGTNLGPFLGVTAVILLEDLAGVTGQRMAQLFPSQAARFLTSFRPIFFGLILMLFLIFEPRGLAHRWQTIKSAWRLRPFSR